jgi:23S rRNA G2445 N2-methylase RlmL
MNPTVAYALNALAGVEKAHSYLNVFSGSGTLLIEAAQANPSLKLVGFDNSKKNLSLAMQNIREARLLRSIELKEKDIFEKPDLGRFDIIASDLPFGMKIGKGSDLEYLYKTFVAYSAAALKAHGALAIYTSETDLAEKVLKQSSFKIENTVELKINTSVNAYLYPKIYICKQK